MKKFETFYALTKDAYNGDIARIDVAENKAARFLTLLTLVIGLTAAGLKHLITAMREDDPSGWNWAFRLAYGVLSLANVVAFVHFLLVFKVVTVKVWPTEKESQKELEKHFRDNPYVDVLASMAREFLESSGVIRKRVDEKPRLVRIGLRWFSVVVAAGIITVICYTMWESGKPEPSGGHMSDNQPEPAPSTPPADTTQPIVVPNPNVQAPKMVDQDRGGQSPSDIDTFGVSRKNP